MRYYRNILLMLFLLALPWQTRWIMSDVLMNEGVSQYGRLSIYAFDVLLIGFLASAQRVWNADAWKLVCAKRTVQCVLVGLWGVVGLSVLSMLWTFEPMVGLFASVHLLLAGLLFTTLMLDREVSPDLILVSLALGMLLPSGLAWIQSAQQSVGASTLLGIAAQDPAMLGTAVVEYADGRWLRAYGSFPHPNILGGFSAIGVLSALIVSLRATYRYLELPLAMAVALMGGALVMAGSRAAWVACVVGVFVLGVSAMVHRRVLKGVQMQTIVLCLLIPMIGVGVALRGPLLTRFDTSQRLEALSATERLDQWADVGGFLQAGAAPVLSGVGAGNYVFALASVRPLWEAWVYQPVHNVPALVLVELGVLGALLALLFVVATDWNAHRYWRCTSAHAAMALGLCVFILAMLDHYLWTQPSGVYVLALLFAVNVKLGEEAQRSEMDGLFVKMGDVQAKDAEVKNKTSAT